MNVACMRCFGRSHFSSLALLMLLAACFLGGCVRSIEPILKEDQLIGAENIAGKWTSEDGKDTIEIVTADGTREFKVLFVDAEGKKGRFIGRLGEFDHVTIFEYHADEPDKDLPEHNKSLILPLCSFMVVQQLEPDMIVSTISYDWFKKYVSDHPGELATKKLGNDNYIITASTEDIQKFILAHVNEKGVTNESQTYIRAKSTTKPAP